jgi:uncharacterized protein
MELLITAFTLGLLGSFHCIGMCGPIALSLPVNSQSRPGALLSIFVYNCGRALTYSLMGIFFGALGKLAFLAGLQQVISIVLGVLILALVLLPKKENRNRIHKSVLLFMNNLKIQLGNALKKEGNKSLLSIGVLNGLLPCGLVYIALAGAGATGSALKGALFMLVFGLATFPVMMAVTFFRELISIKLRNKIRSAVPVFISLMAILLILRGLNLDIPYVSPKIEAEKNKISCCHKNECKTKLFQKK